MATVMGQSLPNLR